ncbi:MAG: cobyrinate a,c-diamide synthase [Thermodesulfobacteriota bacterium]
MNAWRKETGSPGVVISALRGGAGKTLLSIGLVAALRRDGRIVVPFKKGPDYIDAGWLALAADRPCYNLDLFLTPPSYVVHSYRRHSAAADIAVVEGNRGLYDGIDIEGCTSTAEIAKLIGLPVVLCIDGTKSTRTMAAVVDGCRRFDTDVRIVAVILNRVAGARHESILRRSIEHYCGIPVIGALPKVRQQDFPERHMGLLPTQEHAWALSAIRIAADLVGSHVDLEKLYQIAASGSTGRMIGGQSEAWRETVDRTDAAAADPNKPIIGVVKDSAFQFYYPDNIEALEAAGAELLFISPLAQDHLPEVDALYIGGGFPETHAEALEKNIRFRAAVKDGAAAGLPVYAECGGLMYLGERIVVGGRSYEMTGVLPIVFGLSQKPQGHGYTVSVVDRPNPYFEMGTEIRGHEFRYSTVKEWCGRDEDMVFSTKRGTGFQNHRDGICRLNVLASYTHLHAAGTSGWAEALVRKAADYQKQKKATIPSE